MTDWAFNPNFTKLKSRIKFKKKMLLSSSGIKKETQKSTKQDVVKINIWIEIYINWPI